MDQKEKRKSSSAISIFIVAVIALLQLMGSWGIYIVIAIVVLAVVGTFIWAAKMATFKGTPVEGESTGNSNSMRRASTRSSDDRYGRGSQPVRPMSRSTPVYRAEQPRPAFIQAKKENSGYAEELKTLLEAGIIDRAEYLDRMSEL